MSSVGDCTRREGGGKEEGLSGREGLRWEGGEQFRVDREVDGVRGRGGGGSGQSSVGTGMQGLQQDMESINEATPLWVPGTALCDRLPSGVSLNTAPI